MSRIPQIPESELYRIIFEFSGDPQYVLDRPSMTFLAVNNAFVEMLGYSREELLSGKYTPFDLLHHDDHERIRALDEAGRLVIFDRYEVRVLTRDKRAIPVEFTVHNVELGGRPVRIGSFRDVSDRKHLEERLKNELDNQKKKAIETLKSSVRMGQLFEKIQRTPELTMNLLGAENEDDLFARAAKIITDKEGFNAESVTFFLKDGEFLVARFSTEHFKGRRFDLSKSSKYARAARSEDKRAPSERFTEEGFPIALKGKLIGLMYVNYNPTERFLFDESATIRKALRDLTRTIANMLAAIIENIRLFKQVQEQAILDQVSGTYNRRYFDQKIKDELIRAKRYGRPFSLIVLDIDHFKHVNDTYGHLQGDLILRQVAALFRANFREIDIICRYGGDEFVVLLPETKYEGALEKAEQLRSLAEAEKFTNLNNPGKPFNLTISMGVTSNRECDDEVAIFRNADEALYAAKRAGRNRVEGNPGGKCDKPLKGAGVAENKDDKKA